MKPIFDGGDCIALSAVELGRMGRALLPLVLAPCIPALVACSNSDVRPDSVAQVTPAVVGRAGVPPLLLRPLSKSAAEALNRRIPFSTEPVSAALPFRFKDKDDAGARALECLTSAVYYEASGESDDGERAVAQVVLNRVRHPAFPASVCGVVYQGATLRTGCQFSFTCDGSLERVPSRREWDRAKAIAAAALSGAVYAPVGLATHYHTDQVVPYWAPSLAKAVQVGAHIFYRWPGAWGHQPSFGQHYSVAESDPAALRSTALVSHGLWPTVTPRAEPRLALVSDEQTELRGIVNLLAGSSTPPTNAFNKQIRAYFAIDAAKPLLDMLGGKPLKPEGEASAGPTLSAIDAVAPVVVAKAPASLSQLLGDFARESRLTTFLRGHRTLYKSTARQAQDLAEQASADWEAYSGNAVPAGVAVLSLTQTFATDACAALPALPAKTPILAWPADSSALTAADIFFASGLAKASFIAAGPGNPRKAKQLEAAIDPIRRQLVKAVFARIASISHGEAAGRAAELRAVTQGDTLVPVLTKRLRFFEQHRGEYATLVDFLPRLIAGVSPPATKVEACEPAASATADPRPPATGSERSLGSPNT